MGESVVYVLDKDIIVVVDVVLLLLLPKMFSYPILPTYFSILTLGILSSDPSRAYDPIICWLWQCVDLLLRVVLFPVPKMAACVTVFIISYYDLTWLPNFLLLWHFGRLLYLLVWLPYATLLSIPLPHTTFT